jgi:esterase/lipase superfamily enzyme
MRRDITTWWSPSLNKNMEIAAYGHLGPALLMFPSAASDFLEYERLYLIDTIQQFIDAGLLKAYSINSINNESWLNDRMYPRDKAIRHQQYNQYIVEEVVPFIIRDCNGLVPIYTTGVSLGALHAVNNYLRRPDVFAGAIGMSGIYDLKAYSKGYFDLDCYFNSPIDYMGNMNDEYWLNILRSRNQPILASGRGPYEDPSSSVNLGEIIASKGIPAQVELWGHEWEHDWPTWRAMLPHLVGSRLI